MLANFVHEYVSNPGTSTTLNLAGPRTGRAAFDSKFASGSTVFYFMDNGTIWECGFGVITSGSPDTLTRATVIDNSSGTTTRLSFTGDVEVYNAVPASRMAWINNSGFLQISPYAASGATWCGTTGGTATAFTVAQPVAGNSNTEGMLVSVRFHTTPGDQPTLAVGGATARPIYMARMGAIGRPRTGDLLSGQIVEMRYDSTLPGWVISGAQDNAGYRLLAQATISSTAAVDFVLPAAFRRYRLEWSLVQPSVSGFLIARVSTDGTNFDAASGDYYYRGAYADGTTWTHLSDGGAGTSYALTPSVGLQVQSGSLEFSTTGSKNGVIHSAGTINATAPYTYVGMGRHQKNATTITAIRMLNSGGDMATGSVRLLAGGFGFTTTF